MAELDTNSGVNLGMVQDIQNLDRLRQLSQSKEGKADALMAASRQFESIFTQTLFQSMRQANQVLTQDSPFNSSYTQFYEGMLDEQRVADMSSKGASGWLPWWPSSSRRRPLPITTGGCSRCRSVRSGSINPINPHLGRQRSHFSLKSWQRFC